MPREHPHPTTSTIKRLYAHAYCCAYPDCARPLYRVDELTGDWTLNSRICHINARSEGGPRWNPDQSSDENRSVENLVLMCLEHASAIDDDRAADNYPQTILQEWKRLQSDEYHRRLQGWQLTTDMAEAAISASFSNVGIAINQSTVELGGKGGSAPGAGGGGGGAIGEGAIGGKGGHGGDIVSTSLELAEGDSVQLEVGKGGRGAFVPGQHGEAGGDTKVRVIGKDGTLRHIITAKGGKAQIPESLPIGAMEISEADLEGGFQISTLMTVQSAELQNGLLYVLGGGWSRYAVADLPSNLRWMVICAASWVTLDGEHDRAVFLTLTNPRGAEVARVSLVVPASDLHFGDRVWMPQILGAHVDTEGVWMLRAQSGGNILSQLPITVHRAS